MRVLLINTVCGIGSTGRICLDVADSFSLQGHEVKIAFGRGNPSENSLKYAYKIGSKMDQRIHGLQTRILDKHGLGSESATKAFLKWANDFNPDLLWLHNLHGYFINYKLLFAWIKRRPNMQVRWTLHDCWSFTGHCVYFTAVNCEKWKTTCQNCIQKKAYPKSLMLDRSYQNFEEKKAAFTGVKNLQLITPSNWLAELVKESFMREYPVEVRHNKIDLSVFHPTKSNFRERHDLQKKKVILGVAAGWDERKGFQDFIKLASEIDERYAIVLVGVTSKQKELLPHNVIGIKHTSNVSELVEIYSAADVLFNPTYEDNYPTVNLEAEACGTRVITYNTGGAPETLRRSDSVVIPVGQYKLITKYMEE